MTGPTLVTATPPTPNGDLHLGHLSGPYLAADLVTRALRDTGAEVAYVTGSDDHQSYVADRADAEGRTPAEVAAALGDRIERTLAAADIVPDVFLRTATSPLHQRLTREAVERLVANGALTVTEADAPFCPSTGRYLFEAYIRGTCPHCGAGASGNVCEDCGRPNDAGDLRDAVCTCCGATPERHPARRYVLPLERHRERLAAFWASVSMSPHIQVVCERMAAERLPDIAVTHPTRWGIEHPGPDGDVQRVYVWFEMAIGYLLCAALSRGPRRDDLDLGDLADAWNAHEHVVQCFGFDNSYFHAVLFPSVYDALDADLALPSAFIGNEFLRLEGQKFSTSRRHAIWGSEFLAEQPADLVRLYLARIRPVTLFANFTRQGYDTFADGVAGRWQGWLRALGAALDRDCGGVVPEVTEPGAADQEAFLARVHDVERAGLEAYATESFAPEHALRLAEVLVEDGARMTQADDLLVGVPEARERLAAGRACELAAAAVLATVLRPCAPAMHRVVSKALGLSPADGGPGRRPTPGTVLALTDIDLMPGTRSAGGVR